MNRGIARRAVFEDRACVRYFLAKLASVVRRGDLELHAYVLMATHFHLLVRSPEGRLSSAMQRVQNLFVRWFNRRARRDGPLFRGRFLSRPVESLEYRCLLVRYIDQNPVVARLVEAPEQYPHGSARHHARGSGPRWLERTWIEEEALRQSGAARFSPEAYQRAFGVMLPMSAAALVEARIRKPSTTPDPLEHLVRAAPESVLSWMRRKAALADGTGPGLPGVSEKAVLLACERSAEETPDWRLPQGRGSTAAWPALRVALLRDLAGLTWARIGAVTSMDVSAARRRYASHRVWVETEKEYQETLARVSHRCLR